MLDAKIPHQLTQAILAAFLLLLAPSPVGAIATTSCDTFAVVQLPGMDEVRQDDSGPAACASGASDVIAFLNATSGASFGSLFASAEGTYLAGDTDRAEARGYAEFRDTITVTSPGLEGQTGELVASLRVSGFIDLTGSGTGAARVIAIEPSGPDEGFLADCTAGDPTGCLGQPYPAFFDEFVPVVFSVQFGVPGTIGATLASQVNRNSISTDPGSADVNFGSTVTWGGIDEVTFQGAPVPFTVTSESGTDYAEAVPEPGQAALALAGAFGLWAGARIGLTRLRSPRGRRGAGAAGTAR